MTIKHDRWVFEQKEKRKLRAAAEVLREFDRRLVLSVRALEVAYYLDQLAGVAEEREQ